MTFELSKDNENYINARGKIVLNACPGSGKTTAVAYKLSILTKECKKDYGNYSGVACLSFTNVAKDEISEKFEKLSNQRLAYPHLVSTIDSFINKHITLPFYYLLGYHSKRPSILNSVYFLDEMNIGWFANKKNKHIKYSHKPSNLKFELDGTISWKGTYPKPAVINPKTFENYGLKYKNWQLENGYLNNDDSAFIALKLIREFPQIALYLISRFPYIIVDEAQDTSEIQYLILDELIKNGLSNIEYVGDPYQSLYEFREARPEIFLDKYNDSTNWEPHELSTCRRSSQKIIDFYSIFRKKSETQIESISKLITDLPVKVIMYNKEKIDELVDEYEKLIDTSLPYQILVRGSSHLEMFGAITTTENPWHIEIARDLVLANYSYEVGHIKNCIDSVRKIYIQILNPNYDYKQRKEAENTLKADIPTNILLFDLIKNLPSPDDSLENWTINVTSHIKDILSVDVDLKLKMKGKVFRNQNVKTLMYPKTSVIYPVSTIHKVKGMSFNSILLVLSEKGTGQSISLGNFSQPDELPSEKQRMIYVALSRAESFACIAVPDTLSAKEIEDKLGSEVEIVNH